MATAWVTSPSISGVDELVDFTIPPVTGRLYLHNEGHDKALELIPLVQLRDTPQPASYFYSRLEKTGPQLVSHHSACESEISGDGSALLELLADLACDDHRSPES